MVKKIIAFYHRDLYERLDEIVTFVLNLKALLVEVKGLLQLTRNEIMSLQSSAKARFSYSVPEPDPIANDNPSIHDLVIQDLKDRKEFGLQKYGTILQADNNRKGLIDLYQELLDAAAYCRLLIEEENDPPLS